MAFYVVVELDISNPEVFAAYGAAMADLLRTSEAKVLCASEEVTTYEGTRRPQRIVLFEWPDQQTFEQFRYSTEYQAIIGMRLASAETTVLGVSTQSEA